MKKILILFCLTFIICLSGCSNSNYNIYEMKINNDPVDEKIMNEYVSSDDDYTKLLENTPNLMSYLYNVTPKALKKKCAIYRFSYNECGKLGGETFLVYEDQVYQLGTAFGGYGVTEFAYIDTKDQNILYFIFSAGSGIHQSSIGAFDFDTKTLSYYNPKLTDDPFNQSFAGANDIAFYLSEGYLGICEATIGWKSNDTFEVNIIKGENVIYHIKAVDFVSINE